MKMKRITFVVSIFIFTTILSKAQTNVYGIISNNAVWTLANSPYSVIGNILLDSGITLTIEPGVVVKFLNHRSMQINGKLRAIGTASNKIKFTSNNASPSPGDWDNLVFNTQSVDYNDTTGEGSIMKYCIVEYAGGATYNDNGAVRITEAYPLIDHCILRNNSASGLCASLTHNAGTIKITNNEIYNNTIQTNHGGGISINNPSADKIIHVVVDSNEIHDNLTLTLGGGLFAYITNGSINLRYNKLFNNNSSGKGGGIWAGCTPLEISHNTLYNNTSAAEGGGLYTQTASSGYRVVKNNIICHNSAATGGGIFNEGALVKNNIIVNNYANEGGAIATMYYDTLQYNTIADNVANDKVGIYPIWETAGVYNYNTLVRNITLSSSSTSSLMYLYTTGGAESTYLQNCNIADNRATGSTFYNLINNHAMGTANIHAENTWWGSTSTNDIESKIWDFLDDANLSSVNYSPIHTSPDTSAPVMPPVNAIMTDLGGGNIKITWSANTEADIAGYKLYWGSPTGYSFAYCTDAGNNTTDTISGLTITDTIAVTAYDHQADSIDDMFEGHESWFTYAAGKPVPNFTSMPMYPCVNDTMFFIDMTSNNYSYSSTTWLWSFPGGSPATSNEQYPKVIYNTPGIYDVKLVVSNIAGTDSIIMTNYLDVNIASYAVISPTVCNNGYYVSPSGVQTWTNSGTYHDTIPNHAGCDSIITINLTISYDSYATKILGVCDSFTSPSGHYIWTTTGVYKDTIPNLQGCDSILTFNLTFFDLDTSVSVIANTLTSNSTGANFRWLDCNNGFAFITGETLQSFTPAINGSYAVEVSHNTCVDTSLCYQITTVGRDAYNFGDVYNIYPNPASESIIINIAPANIETITFYIYNLLSELVKTQALTQKQNKIDVSGLTDGIYIIEIKSESYSERQKLVVQKTR